MRPTRSFALNSPISFTPKTSWPEISMAIRCPKGGEAIPQRKHEIQYEDLTKIQKGIMSLISENPGKSAVSMAESLDVSERTARSNLSKLMSAGIITRIGSDKKGTWSIIERK